MQTGGKGQRFHEVDKSSTSLEAKPINPSFLEVFL
jgi:hypothetical protein